MTRSFDDDAHDPFRPVSDEERHLKVLFLKAQEYEWQLGTRTLPDGQTIQTRRMRLAWAHMATRFFSEVHTLGERGYDIAAFLIATRMDKIERPVRSNLMTRMARAIPDCIMRTGPDEVHEREIAQFGKIIHRLIEGFPERFLEWAEDMEEDDPWNDLKRQPTAIIRGAFLSPSIDVRRMIRFWELAAASDRFPRRMFSDPCDPVPGATAFTPFHLRRYAEVFSIMPDTALRRFGSWMRERTDTRLLPRVVGDGLRPQTVAERLSDGARAAIFHDIVHQVSDPDRRNALAAVLLPSN